MTHDAETKDAEFKKAVEDAARELVSVKYRGQWAFVVVPALYPSGASAVVRIERYASGFTISDFSLAFHEAEQSGGANIFGRQARAAALRYGVAFDGQQLLLNEISIDQLPGAIKVVASASVETATTVDLRLAERKFVDSAERLYERLTELFKPDNVERDVEVIGASATSWHIAATVKALRQGTPAALFEPVTNHHSSVAHVSMKFRDIALLEQPPKRISIVHSKAELGTYLGVLAQTSSVIEDSASNDALLRVAR